jgi:hypothetical protein
VSLRRTNEQLLSNTGNRRTLALVLPMQAKHQAGASYPAHHDRSADVPLTWASAPASLPPDPREPFSAPQLSTRAENTTHL